MSNQTVSQAVEQRDQGPSALVQQYGNVLGNILPSHIRQQSYVRLLQGLLRRDPNLAKVAGGNWESFLQAALDCARLGLDPGSTYHFVPFGREITGIVDYQGEIELIYRAGAVASIKAEIVYSGDTFRFTPDMDRPHHDVDWFGDRGDMIGVYAYAHMKDGSFSRVVMLNRRDVEQIRASSKAAKAADSPWNKWPDRMWLKTAVHQLHKWVPSSAEYMREHLRAAAEADQARHTPPAPAEPQQPAGPPPEVYDAEVVDEQPDAEK